MGQRTRLAITSGEPAGVGPDLLVALAQRTRRAQWLVFGDADLLRRAAARLKLPLEIDADVENPSRDPAVLTVHHLALPVRERPGVLDVNNAGYVVRMLEAATDHCVAGSCQGLVTAPVQKSIINEAGIPFTGHTEFFRDRAGVSDVVMLLVAGNLRVALATTHVPLKDVAAALTREVLTQTLEILLRGLEGSFGIRRPRVLVAGLNPHAGEGGHLGREEIDTITPVLDAFRARGARLRGPLPADTLFTPRQLAGADAVLAMYHDQGLPVLKYQGFGEAVNVTLGLPFVRTSVDHGTALDLAGTGRADSGSLQAALDLA
ncbi:MAG: 4-hydroxythreonine-4-phosphate dehydrogenase PdxA, partial [Pseudomonadales bacterium]|nr:4-hydroxythreonine-4-phosphate dehydrogenase PdxA [Pseudomonadales bacterium]